MAGGGINTSDTKFEALSVQSSCYGAVIPWLRGMHRIPGNLCWYGDFKATAHTQDTGGKGGGSTNTTYTYSASLVMGLAHGSVAAVPRVWKGKATASLSSLGLSLFTGAVGQTGWSVLNGRGLETLNYSGLVYVAAQAYEFGNSASIENHSFEVQHTSAYSISGTPDVDPAAATYDLLTHPHQGANFPASLIGDWTEWSNYCVANGLLVSPLLTTQVAASEALKTMADLTNSAIVWSGGKLKVRPYGDTAATGHGRTFTPDTTPVYQLNDDCYVKPDNDAPVKRALKTEVDCFNIINLQYRDRANGYNPGVVQAKDRTDISANGARPRDQIQAEWICDGTVARLVAELRKQRDLLVLGTFTFRLPWHFALLEVMDLVTLTDSVLRLFDVPARVAEISEESDEELLVVCEDYPAGVASAPLYGAQGMTGYAMDANVAPGDTLAPVVFELPGALSTTGLELGIAAAGTDSNWGGCQVWVSYDGTTYRQIAELRQKSRYGVLTADGGSTLALTTNAGQQLLSGSASDLAALSMLLYVTPAGAVTGEYLAYQTATLTGAGAYTLSTLSRAAYGTTQGAHTAGTAWARVDDAIARTGPLDPALIGKTVYIKLLSVNVFGNAVQSLGAVSATTYVITGAHFVSPSATLAIKTNVADFAGTLNYNECWIHGRDASGVAIDAPGKILINGQPVLVPNGLLYGSQGPYAGYIVLDQSRSTFTVGGNAGYAYAAARRYAGVWQYDNNGSWVNFTPTSAHYIIGTVQTGGPDTGFPGAPPGVIAASMWAHASTLDSLVANQALPSIKVLGDNNNANAAGFSGKSVSFSTGYTDSSGTRGHTLVVYDPATDAVSSLNTYDTYGSGTAALVTALGTVPAGRIVALYTYDASTHDAALRTALQDFGGSGSSALWTANRTSHAFIGQRGLAPGQAFEAISSASDATGVVSLQAYYSTSGLVSNGAAGAAGASGLTNALVYIYQRSASGAPALPSATATYTFATAALTGLNNGWSATPPAGTDPLYMSVATASSSGAGDTIASGEWASVVLLAANGANGSNGSNGTNGSNGSNGVNAATVYLFQRTSTASAPSLPSASVTYDFSTAVAGGVNNGWVQTLPTTGGAYRWVTTASALSTTGTDTIASGEWAAAALLAQDGSDGSNGTNGTNGVDGQDAIAMTISAASVTLQADSAGVVADYSPAVTVAKVMKGASDDTSNWTITRTNGSGVSSSLSGATLTVTAMSGDTGYVDITATRTGYASQTARFSLAKARAAAPTSGTPSGLFFDSQGYSSGSVRFNSDGTVSAKDYAGTYQAAGNWYTPTTSGIGGSYWIKVVPRAGSAAFSSGTSNTWLAMSSALSFINSVTGTNARETFADYFIATSSTGAGIVATGSIDVVADTT
ncbi:MAG: hypothetical protein SHS37scaffold296_13 [Burkholderiales phage 68_11]|nr:MAG: hypothetical protein SHS37scaffold296_13 [Burkholderiales phage 68_11]